MQGIRALGIAGLIATTPAMALDQGDYQFNGFGTAGLTHLGARTKGAVSASAGRQRTPGAVTSSPGWVASSNMGSPTRWG